LTKFFLLLLAGILTGCGSDPASLFPPEARGKIVLVNYWAEWCKPCREEIPDLNRFVVENGDKVALYGVNFDGAAGDELARQERMLGVEFPTLTVDPGPGLGWPIPEGLPHTVVTDSDGSRMLALVGVQTHESLAKAVDQFLGEGGEQ